jgi:phosphatidylserine/phosphatidylglycerophosphate/cardiolipin synthase-like enzyme
MNKRNGKNIMVIGLFSVLLLLVGATPHSKLHTVKNFKFYLGEPIKDGWVKLINQAEESVEVGMYFGMPADSYITKEVYQALIEAKKRGAEVHVGFDRRSEEAVKYLRDNNIDVEVYSDTRIHHLKGIVVDNKYVFVGSQNISYSGLQGRNWSSGVIFKSPEMAERFNEYLRKQE